MKRTIFKPILAGILLGAAAFFMPLLLLKAVFFFLIIGFILRSILWRRYHRGAYLYVNSADKIRNMSEEEYTDFKNKMKNSFDCESHKRTYNCNPGTKWNDGCGSDTIENNPNNNSK